MTMATAKFTGYVLSLLLFGLGLAFGQEGGSEVNVDGTPDTEIGPVAAEEEDEKINENRRISIEAEEIGRAHV